MANYTKTTIGKENRIELHEKLSLTGAEISLNELPAGANVPFVHSHKENEEIYGILSGNGKAIIDGEEIKEKLRINSLKKVKEFSLEAMEQSLLSVFDNITTKKSDF